MTNNRFGDSEINEGIAEYIDHKNPVFDKEWGGKINGPTLFDLYESLKGKKEDYEDNTPLDEEGNLCVDWFFDFRTGELKKDVFSVQHAYKVKNKTYTLIRVNKSNRTFIVDFDNKTNFPGMEKGEGRYICSIESFGKKEVIILESGLDNTICIDTNGKQIGKTCISIEKIVYGDIDILEFTGRVDEKNNNSLEVKHTYLGSDGRWYRPNVQESSEGCISSFTQISNLVKSLSR